MVTLQQIEDLVCGKATFSEKENRVYVTFTGVKTAYELKHFMEKNGFQDVYGTYEDGFYTLGFSGGELS